MKKLVVVIFSFLILTLPNVAPGQDSPDYVAVKPGVYFFTGEMESVGHGVGFNGDITYGRYLTPHVAIEGGAGYMHDGTNGKDIKAWLVNLTAKGVYAVKKYEFFAGAGLGAYKAEYHGVVKGARADGKDTVFGGHLVAGATRALSSSYFVVVEGKYIFTEKADFNTFRPDLDGYTTTIGIGIRL